IGSWSTRSIRRRCCSEARTTIGPTRWGYPTGSSRAPKRRATTEQRERGGPSRLPLCVSGLAHVVHHGPGLLLDAVVQAAGARAVARARGSLGVAQEARERPSADAARRRLE